MTYCLTQKHLFHHYIHSAYSESVSRAGASPRPPSPRGPQIHEMRTDFRRFSAVFRQNGRQNYFRFRFHFRFEFLVLNCIRNDIQIDKICGFVGRFSLLHDHALFMGQYLWTGVSYAQKVFLAYWRHQCDCHNLETSSMIPSVWVGETRKYREKNSIFSHFNSFFVKTAAKTTSGPGFLCTRIFRPQLY